MVGQFASQQQFKQILPKELNQEQVTPVAFLLMAWSQKGTESICISVIFQMLCYMTNLSEDVGDMQSCLF